ncbi:thymidine kinase 1, soluble [Chelydra serpentina]|uniref:Thymidine kinase n=1 Tax=Chelydra serpentina TaxID=8475 RepID=A0A8T1T7H0_CHESE|nr:thymidine kinase 1, soluble [Chelydra serpentina]
METLPLPRQEGRELPVRVGEGSGGTSPFPIMHRDRLFLQPTSASGCLGEISRPGPHWSPGGAGPLLIGQCRRCLKARSARRLIVRAGLGAGGMSCLNVPGVQPGSPAKARGQIQVIFGPMFSGKSTELMRRVRRFQIAQYKCLVIKYAKDTRYCTDGVSTHDRNTMEALSACYLGDVHQEALGSAVIGIDEGQFFPDIVEFCETMANAGKTVIVAALDGTFQRKVISFSSG